MKNLATKRIYLTEHNKVKLGSYYHPHIEQWKCAHLSNRPRYLAPEIKSATEFSEKADIWTLGVILYEMASFDTVRNE